MSRMVAGIVSIVALSATFGAIQLAAGRDLVTTGTGSAKNPAAMDSVNRAGKSDRAAINAASGPSQTIMVQPDGLSSTSVLIRVPTRTREEARNRPSSNGVTREQVSTRKVACEPVVSVLTEVAKLLQPGRCVT